MTNKTPQPSNARLDVWIITLIWCALMGSALLLRPLLPIDETRYITVAWEMWTNSDFWVPTLNGEIYSHKPPFLFWFMHLGWAIFGVSDIWARLVAPLFGLGALFITAKLARELWPDVHRDVQNNRAWMAPMMLVSGIYWTIFSTMTMFDMLVTLAAVVALLGYVKAWKGFVTGTGFWTGMLIAGIGIGIGGLAKGPAILIHTLPVALAAPLWGPYLSCGRGESRMRTWYLGVFASVVVGFAMTLAWAIPAALIGGPEYRDAIFIKQSTDRMVKSFAHRRPFYWFALVMPALLLPWTLWPRLWKNIGFIKAWKQNVGLRSSLTDGGARFLLICIGASFVIFSAISGKQPHYLLPIFPALTLFTAYMLTREGNVSVERGHKVPVLVMGGLVLIFFVGLMAKGVIEPMLKTPLPDWIDLAQPLWLLPVLGLAGVLAFKKVQGPSAEVRLIAITVASVIVSLYMATAPALAVAYNLQSAALQVKAYQDEGRPVAYVGKYHGEFQFLGRLTQPLYEMQHMEDGQIWAKSHGNGIVMATMRRKDVPPLPKPVSIQPYRGKVLVIWNAADF